MTCHSCGGVTYEEKESRYGYKKWVIQPETVTFVFRRGKSHTHAFHFCPKCAPVAVDHFLELVTDPDAAARIQKANRSKKKKA